MTISDREVRRLIRRAYRKGMREALGVKPWPARFADFLRRVK